MTRLRILQCIFFVLLALINVLFFMANLGKMHILGAVASLACIAAIFNGIRIERLIETRSLFLRDLNEQFMEKGKLS